MTRSTEDQSGQPATGRGARLLARMGFPEGALPIGLGLMISGICAYGFLVLSGRALGPVRYSQLSVLWSATFLLGTGLFQPLEQEIARVLSVRRTKGLGSRPVVIRGARIAMLVLGVLVAVSFSWQERIVVRFFDGDYAFLLALALGLLGLGLAYVARGFLSGTRLFRPYGALNAVEGLVRLVPAAVLAFIGVAWGLPYAVAFAVAPLLAALATATGPFRRLETGPRCAPGELDLSLGKLIAASVLAQALINLPVLTVKFLADESQGALTGTFMAGVIVARVPVVLFAAVQAALVPKLASLAALSKPAEFRSVLTKLTLALGVVGVVATVGAATLGGPVIRIFFGESFQLPPKDMAYLAAASAFYLLALALAQGLVAVGSYFRLVVGWGTGLLVGLLLTMPAAPLLVRVERGFLAGALAAFVTMGLIVFKELAGSKIEADS